MIEIVGSFMDWSDEFTATTNILRAKYKQMRELEKICYLQYLHEIDVNTALKD